MRATASLIFVAALALAAPVRLAAESPLTGAVVVIDGDSIEIGGRRLHLQGIDAPELGQECSIARRAYDCGMVARAALLDLTAGAHVACAVREGSAAREDGQPAQCWADGYDLSEGMVYTGWALATATAPPRYGLLQEAARRETRGLWKGRFLAPQRWRANLRANGVPADR